MHYDDAKFTTPSGMFSLWIGMIFRGTYRGDKGLRGIVEI